MNNQFPLKVLALEFDVSTHSIAPRVRSISSDNILQDMYKIIGCHLVTCTQIQVNGQYFDIWSDDEALFNSPLAPSLYINDDFVLFGNLIFAKSDNDTDGLFPVNLQLAFIGDNLNGSRIPESGMKIY